MRVKAVSRSDARVVGSSERGSTRYVPSTCVRAYGATPGSSGSTATRDEEYVAAEWVRVHRGAEERERDRAVNRVEKARSKRTT